MSVFGFGMKVETNPGFADRIGGLPLARKGVGQLQPPIHPAVIEVQRFAIPGDRLCPVTGAPVGIRQFREGSGDGIRSPCLGFQQRHRFVAAVGRNRHARRIVAQDSGEILKVLPVAPAQFVGKIGSSGMDV